MNVDPLLVKSSTELMFSLFRSFSQASNGHGMDTVTGASANMLVNAICQTHHKRVDAEKAYDELFARMKEVLMSHYGPNTRLNGMFPFNQTIHANLHVEKDKFGGN